ncbi:MAG: riboflavin biosynthesis protein RibF [Paludibacteraceae bacterium]|nr:riboflavin biosynthesis protein RibF [Paludibacteraceae bacterium]
MLSIATIGFFDGVHKGHQYLFAQLQHEAQERHLQPLLVTFDTHPRAVLQADYIPQLLTSLDERKALLSTFGEVLVLPFADIYHLKAQEFMRFLYDQYQVTTLLMGYDHQFGSDRLRSPEDYRCLGEQVGIEVLSWDEFVEGERHVSSTEIRQALLSGHMEVANELLGRPYSITGIVSHGKGIGRTIGFPTANIVPSDSHKIIPEAGVYAVYISHQHSAISHQLALCNIGTNPTIGNNTTTIEVYIPHFNGDLYDQALTIEFARRIREEQKFDSLDALRTQIQVDLTELKA